VQLRNEARVLKGRRSPQCQRDDGVQQPHDGGSVLHLRHAFEMQIKATLVQDKLPRVFDKETGRSIGRRAPAGRHELRDGPSDPLERP
jgi:hypothetical protein